MSENEDSKVGARDFLRFSPRWLARSSCCASRSQLGLSIEPGSIYRQAAPRVIDESAAPPVRVPDGGTDKRSM